MENIINAEELRLGNYVDVPRKDQSPFRIDAFESLSKTFIKVAMIHPIHGKFFHPLTWYGDDLKPIPLTEEWLVNFGFEDKKTFFNLSKREDLGHHFGDFAVSRYDDTQMKVWRGDSRYLGIFHIQYVHQLQNFYFALTGEELILKIELNEK